MGVLCVTRSNPAVLTGDFNIDARTALDDPTPGPRYTKLLQLVHSLPDLSPLSFSLSLSP